MNCKILHECRGRIRVHVQKPRLTMAEADLLEERLRSVPGVTRAVVYDRTGDAVIVFQCGREQVVTALASFTFDAAPQSGPESSGRALNRQYQEKLVGMVLARCVQKLSFPAPLRAAWTVFRSLRFLLRGVRCLLRRKLEVEVLDALSIGVSIVRGDFSTAASVKPTGKEGQQ